MKLVYSHWSAPRRPTSDHRVIFCLSVLLARKHYSRIELVTDYAGAWMVERLKLPFDRVRTDLQEFEAPATAWAAGKIKAYQLQDEPFIHLDQDVLLFNRLPDYIEKAPLVAQSQEPIDWYYVNMAATPAKHVEKLSCPRHDWSAINAGILGGTDIEFIRDYATKALEAINENTAFNPLAMTIYEQAFYSRHARDCGKEITVLLDYDEQAEEKGYCHLMGCKQKESCMVRVRQRLQDMDNAMYQRAVLAGGGSTL
jgi:hypothetical protein